MRLICPNCGAKYEVPDDVIPEGGRDVQCSNCGDTWFQKHPSQDRELSEELEQPLDEAHWEDADHEAEAETQPEIVAEAEPEPEEIPEPEPEMIADSEEPASEFDEWDDFEEADEAPVEPETGYEAEPEFEPEAEYEPDPEPERQPRELDPEVSEILREEAEREQQARAAENAGGIETQPDLGLADPPDVESLQDREARLRMARMRGLSEEEAMGAAAGLAANASRRDLLPDIEEINSSLRKDTDRAEAAEFDETTTPARPRRGGFSRGFLMMILLAVILILLYAYADKITEMLPALGGVMEGYVAAVDGGRVWLDQQVLALMGWLDSMTSETPTES